MKDVAHLLDIPRNNIVFLGKNNGLRMSQRISVPKWDNWDLSERSTNHIRSSDFRVNGGVWGSEC